MQSILTFALLKKNILHGRCKKCKKCVIQNEFKKIVVRIVYKNCCLWQICGCDFGIRENLTLVNVKELLYI